MTSFDQLAERGIKPTVKIVRQAVEAVGGRWPWAGKSPDADVQVLRSARTQLKLGKLDDVDGGTGPKAKQPMRTG